MKLGSLFDGAGTCPLAGILNGFEPVWASEIEPFPIAVTSKRFPNMKHLGDITKINGAAIEPVDLITFGSPCQDLSVAGKRAGIDGTRSGLFMEAIRIFKEMRGATNGEYPKVVMWENVPGVFSSNKGEDFRVVLEELCKVKDSNAAIPRPQKWSDAGLIMGDGYSVAWRVLDAQFWGVPQRRRRIYLVADFGGQCAGEILFKSEGLQRSFAESRQAWDYHSEEITKSLGEAVYDARGNGDGRICPTITGDQENRITDYTALVVPPQAKSGRSGYVQSKPDGRCEHDTDCEEFRLSSHPLRDRKRGVQVVSIDRAAFNQGENAKYNISIDTTGVAPTVVARGASAVGIFWNGEEICATLTANNAGGGSSGCLIRTISTALFNKILSADLLRKNVADCKECQTTGATMFLIKTHLNTKCGVMAWLFHACYM